MGGIGKNQFKEQDILVCLFSSFLHATPYIHLQRLLCTCIFSIRITLLMVLWENTPYERIYYKQLEMAATISWSCMVAASCLSALARVAEFKDVLSNV
jgi:hypothetical protein